MTPIDKPPKVTICVVTYNQDKYIRDCLQSIIDQITDFKFEIIISDDHSTDNTQIIIKEFAEKYPDIILPIFHKKNIGPFNNFVRTHNHARGEFISHCDGDDLFLPNKLQTQVSFLEKNPSCTVCWHRVNLFDDYGNFFSGELGDYSMFDNGIVTFEKALQLGAVATHSSIMYRKSARLTFSPEFDTLDLYYSWEYLSSGWGVILNNILGEYRVGSVGAMTKSKKTYNIRSLYAQHASFFYKKFPEKRKEIYIFALTNFLIDLKNKRGTSLKFLKLAIISFSPINLKDFLVHLKEVRKLRVPSLYKRLK